MDSQSFPQAEGVTPSERYLAKLCRNSFLSMWSYSGIYRDQGKSSGGHGKEVCDLLVIFGDHILIFSDKFCEFPDTGDLQTDWNRWYRKAVKKSAEQIWGAERWIREFPNRLYTDRACTMPIPIDLPDRNSMKIHRIAVAHGASQRCEREFGGGSGSLLISTSPIEDDRVQPLNEGKIPFTIGLIDSSKGFIHVLDDTTLDIVLKELDTVSDFVGYLTKKEHFISNYAVFATGEEELLAFYMSEINDAGEHDFIIQGDFDQVGIPEGFWYDFVTSGKYHAKQQSNRISYAWDSLIEKFNHHILTNTQYFTTHPNSINDNEKIIRFMASESRVRRRMLAKILYDFCNDTEVKSVKATVSVPSNNYEICYIFLIVVRKDSVDYERYRQRRLSILEAYCRVAKLRFPTVEHIVGIAMQPMNNSPSSEDALYYDASLWTDAEREEAEQIQNVLPILKNTTSFNVSEKEFPDMPHYGRHAKVKPHKIPRNAPCPCGSGKKYKKCCLKNRSSN